MALTEEEARYWRKAHSWDLEEAWALIEKQTYRNQLPEAPHEVDELAWEFKAKLEHFNGTLSGYGLLEIDLSDDMSGQRHSPKKWIEWCDKADVPVPECLREDRLSEFPREDKSPATNDQWPWGDYETELLVHLAAAATKFWKNYDPTDNTTAPTNERVSRWLQEEKNVSQRTAEAMASILRPDRLPTGPRK